MSKKEMKTNDMIISDLYGAEIDLSKEPRERMISFLDKVKTPNRIQGDGYQIELAWSNTERTIQECIQELITLTN